MQTLNYWKQFESTGKVEDYLSYRRAAPGRQDLPGRGAVQDRERTGEDPYAGVYLGNGDCFEAGAYRGI